MKSLITSFECDKISPTTESGVIMSMVTNFKTYILKKYITSVFLVMMILISSKLRKPNKIQPKKNVLKIDLIVLGMDYPLSKLVERILLAAVKHTGNQFEFV